MDTGQRVWGYLSGITPFEAGCDLDGEQSLQQLLETAGRGSTSGPNGNFITEVSEGGRIRICPRTHDVVPVFRGHLVDDDDGAARLVGTIGPDGPMLFMRGACALLITLALAGLLLARGVLTFLLVTVVVGVGVPALIAWRSQPWRAARSRSPGPADTFRDDLTKKLSNAPGPSGGEALDPQSR